MAPFFLEGKRIDGYINPLSLHGYIFAGAEFVYVEPQLSETRRFNWTTFRVPVWNDGGWESISVKLCDSATVGGDKSTFSVLVLDLSCFFKKILKSRV